jgi:predicted nucleic acid-binding protein
MEMNNRFLLDTTVFIDYLRGVGSARKLIADCRDSRIVAGYSIITEAELWAGITGQQTEESHLILLKPFRRYQLSSIIARRAGAMWLQIKNNQPRGTTLPDITDCLIAATAEFHQLTVVTRNENHFKQFQIFGMSIQFYIR